MTTNCKPDDCFGTVGPFTSTGTPIVPEPATPCPIPVPDPANRLWQMSENGDACFVDGLVNEALGIAGATMNVYKLLGIHEQSKLIDATGVGKPISNGDLPGFPAKNAFDIYVTEWRSIQKGTNVLASAFIGYDFGEIKVSDNSRDMYSVDAHVRKHITAFSIKQSSSPRKRATKVR